MTAEMTIEEYQTLTRCQKVKKFLPKALPILLLSVILPTADVGTDLALITKLYKGLTACGESGAMKEDYEEWRKCEKDRPEKYCNTTEKVSKNTVCGVSQYYCMEVNWRFENEWLSNEKEYRKCQKEVGPDQYCTYSERVSRNSPCRRVGDGDSQYFCRYYIIWSSDRKDYSQCEAQGANKYCSDPASNQNVCNGSHPKTASSLLFFFLLNYVMGLVTCIRLEERKWVPLITALFNLYPQYCKDLILMI